MQNFTTIKDLDKIRKICNTQGQLRKKVKMYLTLNTIVYDEELSKIEKLIKRVRKKVDAIICWDLSVINLCRKYKYPFIFQLKHQSQIPNPQSFTKS
jgi:putative protease